MIISKNENNTYDITGITEYDVMDLCDAIDNAPLNLKRNLYNLRKGLEHFLVSSIKHQPVKK